MNTSLTYALGLKRVKVSTPFTRLKANYKQSLGELPSCHLVVLSERLNGK